MTQFRRQRRRAKRAQAALIVRTHSRTGILGIGAAAILIQTDGCRPHAHNPSGCQIPEPHPPDECCMPNRSPDLPPTTARSTSGSPVKLPRRAIMGALDVDAVRATVPSPQVSGGTATDQIMHVLVTPNRTSHGEKRT